ncbi:hypothetical protein MMC18_002431 [Xylographa bjoerkii]|nr:hypothetical protein [Xylographa bjoerkii]
MTRGEDVNVLPAIMFPLETLPGAINPIRDVGFRLAASDSAAFHGMLSISALHLTTFYGDQVFQDSVMHNTIAINLVNQRLNDPVSSVSDGQHFVPLVGERVVSEEHLRDNTKANQQFPALSIFPSLIASSSSLSMLPILSQGAHEPPAQYGHEIVSDLLKLFDDLKELRTLHFAIQRMLPWFSDAGTGCSSSEEYCDNSIRRSFYVTILIYVDTILRTVHDEFPATSRFVLETLKPALFQFTTHQFHSVEMLMLVLLKDDWSAWNMAEKAWDTAMAVRTLISMSWEEWRRVEHTLERFTSSDDRRHGPNKGFWDAVLA